MQKILALITARGGSKGLPGKNTRVLGDRPLIAWSIDAAHGARHIARTIVSTDDNAIADVARKHGAEVPCLRPAALAQDNSPHIDVVLHTLDALKSIDEYVPDALMLLQPTSPFRTSADIDSAVELARTKNAPAVVSVVETHDHPFLARRLDGGGRMSPFVPCDLGYPRRQDLPPAYALNGAIYLCRVDILRDQRTFEPPGCIGYVMPPERSLQIDTPWDFELCSLIAAAPPTSTPSARSSTQQQVKGGHRVAQ